MIVRGMSALTPCFEAPHAQNSLKNSNEINGGVSCLVLRRQRSCVSNHAGRANDFNDLLNGLVFGFCSGKQ
jgi:hypothetical protein